MGITSRLINADGGDEFLRATIGQILYFSDREVTLPGGATADSNKSDYLFEFGMKLAERWRTQFNYQYNSDDRETRWNDIRLNYRASDTKIANFGYRYRKDLIEEIDVSAAWPVADAGTWLDAITIRFSTASRSNPWSASNIRRAAGQSGPACAATWRVAPAIPTRHSRCN